LASLGFGFPLSQKYFGLGLPGYGFPLSQKNFA
jgi:hypothetical protein